jgi:hypothetical protein
MWHAIIFIGILIGLTALNILFAYLFWKEKKEDKIES